MKLPLANAIRALSMDAVEKANSGHPGMPMGMADVATVLFTEFLKFNPKDPHWPDRDRFVLSAGHGSMLLYSLLYLTGYPDMTLDEIKNFRQWGAKTAGHPEFGHATGIETTTGPLGQGITNAVGMALAERMLAARHPGSVDHHTYVIAGDGCLMEGISQEAISFAGHLKLNKLIVLWDDNSISIDGAVELSSSEDQLKRFQAAGWNTLAIDGHNEDQIRDALTKAQKSDKPIMIACKTVIGYGAPKKAGTSGCHGSPLGAEEIKGARQKLNWSYEPFDIPADILAAWRKAGERSLDAYKAWKSYPQKDKIDIKEAVAKYKAELFAKQPKEATRQSSGNALEMLCAALPELIGGSADLTGSNLTKTKAMQAVKAPDYSGSYIYYGIREHAMGAIMNGIALHGGFIPYSGTFLVFTDYCRPAIRLSALMQQRVIYVMTHDSIGLGEDGPTHQPVEHLASLRVIPNLLVMRPADAVETLECWQIALESTTAPSILALSRQAVPAIRKDGSENLSAKGGYIISPAENPKVTIMATGTEVAIAIEAQAKLKAEGIAADVVSLPCFELFDKQPEAYKKSVLRAKLRVGVEAALKQGWESYLGENGIFIGMEGFGASAPAPELYKQFGITADNIVKKVKERL
jgi:transketolase